MIYVFHTQARVIRVPLVCFYILSKRAEHVTLKYSPNMPKPSDERNAHTGNYNNYLSHDMKQRHLKIQDFFFVFVRAVHFYSRAQLGNAYELLTY